MARISFWLGAILIVALPVFFAIYQSAKPGTILVMIAPGAAIAILAKIDLISEFSLGPLKAKMKETITDAEDTLRELKRLSLAFAEPQLTQLMAGNFGFSDGLDFFRRRELADGICESLRQLGIPEPEIKAARTEWDNGLTQIFANEIQHRFERRKEPRKVNFDEPERRKIGESFKKFVDFGSGWRAPSYNAIISFFSDNGFRNLDEDVKVALSAYDKFERTGQLGDLRTLFTHLRQ